MKKDEFLRGLKLRLGALPHEEELRAAQYYDELISDAVDSGKDEDEFIASLGPINAIAAQIKADAALSRAEKKPGPRGWTIALISVLGVLAAPIAIPLAVVIIAIALVIVAVWVSIVIALAAVVLGLGFAGVVMLFAWPLTIGGIGGALCYMGIAVLAAVGVYYVAIWLYKCTKSVMGKTVAAAKTRMDSRKGVQ